MSGTLCSRGDMLLEYTLQKVMKAAPAIQTERLWQHQLLPKLQGLQLRSKWVPDRHTLSVALFYSMHLSYMQIRKTSACGYSVLL